MMETLQVMFREQFRVPREYSSELMNHENSISLTRFCEKLSHTAKVSFQECKYIIHRVVFYIMTLVWSSDRRLFDR